MQHSDTWIWAVVGGLAIAGLLLFHVLHGILNALPAEVRAPLNASAKANSRPLAVLAVVVIWTATYALYSIAHITGPASTLSSAGAAQNNGAAQAPTASPATTPGTTPSAPPGVTAPGTTAGTVSGPALRGTTSPITDRSNPTVANSTVFGGTKTKPAQSYHDSTIFKP